MTIGKKKNLGSAHLRRKVFYPFFAGLFVLIFFRGIVIFEGYTRILLSPLANNNTTETKASSLFRQKNISSGIPEEAPTDNNEKLPEILILCTPWGGLTNVKQRLLGCLKSSSKKYHQRDIRFLLPWLLARANPIAGPFIPLELVFDVNHWLTWTQAHGYVSFLHQPNLQWKQIIGSDTINPKPGSPWAIVDQYYNNISSWAEKSNVTLLREIGDLLPIEPDFGTNAFVLRNDLLPKSSNGFGIIDDACMVHARIEKDWLKFSNNGTNTAIYTSLDKILSSLDMSQVCMNTKEKRPTFLTADVDAVKSQCLLCSVFNNTGLDYYIQSAAVDFHRALKADIFIGNIISSFSALVIVSRSFERTYTYSEINGTACIRPVFQPGYNCTNCLPVKLEGFGMVTTPKDCIIVNAS